MGIIYLHACEKALSLLVEDMVVCMVLCLGIFTHKAAAQQASGLLRVQANKCLLKGPECAPKHGVFILINYNFYNFFGH